MKSLLLAFSFYFALVTGGVLPVVDLGLPYLLARVIVIGAVCFAVSVEPPSQRFVATLMRFAFVAAIAILLFSFDVPDTTYALKKADAFVFGTLTTSVILNALVKRASLIGAFHNALIVGWLVLVSTLIYKLLFGFWDREVVFLMNGPIVFAWLMGMFALMGGFLFWATNRRRYIASSIIFCLAVLWTESKGPLVALVLASLLFLVVTAIRSRKVRYACLLLLGGSSLLLTTDGINTSALEDTRFAAFGRIVTNQLDESDAGSVSSRAEMFQQGIELVVENPLSGTGFSGWQRATNSVYTYPHNVTLEIFVEFGLIVALLGIGAFGASLFGIPLTIRILVFFFVICNSLSGDVGYLRFALCFIFVAHATRERRGHA